MKDVLCLRVTSHLGDQVEVTLDRKPDIDKTKCEGTFQQRDLTNYVNIIDIFSS